MTGKQMGRWAWFGCSTAIGCAAALALVTLASAAEPAKWELSVAANDFDEAQIAAGWPVLLRASVVWTAEGPGFDTFDPTQAAWTVASAKGEPQPVQIVQLSGPRNKTRIDASNDTLPLIFGISPEQTAKADGGYVLTLNAAGQQARVQLMVNPVPAHPDAKFQSDRRFVFAEYDLAAGDAAGERGRHEPGRQRARSAAAQTRGLRHSGGGAEGCKEAAGGAGRPAGANSRSEPPLL